MAKSSVLHLDRTFKTCPYCKTRLWYRFLDVRRVITLSGPRRVRLKVYRCSNLDHGRWHETVFRPELEGRLATRYAKFGLDVVAFAGIEFRPRHGKLELHRLLKERGVEISPRSVSSLLHDYQRLLDFPVENDQDCRGRIDSQGSVILDVFHLTHELLRGRFWVIRDWLSGMILCMRRTTNPEADLHRVIGDVWRRLRVPIAGFTSDGTASSRRVIDQLLHRCPDRHQLHLPISIESPPGQELLAEFQNRVAIPACSGGASEVCHGDSWKGSVDAAQLNAAGKLRSVVGDGRSRQWRDLLGED